MNKIRPIKAIYETENRKWERYIVAIFVPIISAIFRMGFLGVLGTKVAYVTFYPAVIITAFYGGFYSGLISTIISAMLASYFWIEPVGHIYISTFADWLSMIIFIFSCLMISGISEARNRAQERLQQRTKELVEARDQAQKANKAKSIFLANISHELRTPLNSILGYSQLMKRDISLPPEQHKYLDIINRSGEHLLSLINEILEITKIEASHVVLEPSTFELNALIGEIESMFKVKTVEKNIEFKVVGVNEVPCYLIGDEAKLRIVLINLLGNAVKFTEKGSIELRFKLKKEHKSKITLIIEVEDTGAGIAADEMNKLFISFEQTESGKLNKSGTGLGLAISQNYVMIMGGTITVTSSVGQGSIFHFQIDVKKGYERDLQYKPHSRIVIGLEVGQCIPRVLVVDDILESRELLIKLLKTVGFDVRDAVNGKEAVEVFDEWKPDFIWMDIRMSVMDGLEATKIIKATERGEITKIAALTAHASNEDKQIILAAGCDDFVRKPYKEDEIFGVMKKQLGLEYVYLDKDKTQEAPLDITELTFKNFEVLPKEVILDLIEATVKLDTVRILELIEQIISIDISIGANMKIFAERMDYYGLLFFLKEIKDIREENYEET